MLSGKAPNTNFKGFGLTIKLVKVTHSLTTGVMLDEDIYFDGHFVFGLFVLRAN